MLRKLLDVSKKWVTSPICVCTTMDGCYSLKSTTLNAQSTSYNDVACISEGNELQHFFRFKLSFLSHIKHTHTMHKKYSFPPLHNPFCSFRFIYVVMWFRVIVHIVHKHYEYLQTMLAAYFGYSRISAIPLFSFSSSFVQISLSITANI